MTRAHQSPTGHLGPVNSLKRVGKKLLEPQGKVRLLDDLVLLLWDGYALAKRDPGNRENRRGVKGELLTKDPGLQAGSFQSPAFWREHIMSNVLRFWAQYSVDHQYGGFWVDLARDGQPDLAAGKSPGFQARMVFGFSVGYGLRQQAADLGIAEQGVRFLLQHLWDHENGGWYRLVHRDGRVARPEKDITHHAYTLVGLLEYYRVTRDPTVFEHAIRTYELLERHAWDRQHLGYYAECHRNWTLSSSKKVLCTQLAALAAFLSFYSLTGEAVYLDRLRQLGDLLASQMRDRRHGCTLENFHRGWNYNPLATRDKIEFGHTLKSGRLLLEVFRLTKDEVHYKAAKEMIDYAIQHAWDARHHGFYHFGYRNGSLAKGDKVFWTETEGLPALSLLHLLSGDSRYLDYFMKLAKFCFAHFVDRQYGEWFKRCHPDGTVKDSGKRDAFHTVQACWYASNYLEETARAGAASA